MSHELSDEQQRKIMYLQQHKNMELQHKHLPKPLSWQSAMG
jgi:hypothetical protein